MRPTSATTTSPIQDKWWRSPGILYFIAAGSPPNAIKIGVSTRTTVKDRFRKIQTGNHETLELIGVIAFDSGEFPMKDTEDKERLLHIEFAAQQRFKSSTAGYEWFAASRELLAYIAEHTTPPEKLDLPRFVATPINRQ